MRLLAMIFLFLLIFSCTKKNKSNEPFIGNMEINSTQTSKFIAVGQDIISNIKMVVPSRNGEITFLGFEIIENPVKIYSIKATALYEFWDLPLSLPVYETFDSTVTINTKLTGLHILNFYNAAILFKSDTVQVN